MGFFPKALPNANAIAINRNAIKQVNVIII